MKNTAVIWLIIFVIILSCAPLFKNIHNVNLHYDWLQMLSYYRADRQALLQYHQIPFRTYYFGGGYPLLANPQDGFLNPFFVPVLIAGEVIGLKINLLLAHIIGALGMYYLARHVLKYNYLGVLFSTFVFCLGGNIHRLLIRGQEYIVGFYFFFMPVTFAFFIKAKEDKKFLFYTILVLTVIITQVGAYIAPILLFLFLFSCLKAIKHSGKKFVLDFSYLKIFFIIIFPVFLLGAVKTFPMMELIMRNPRVMDSYNPFWGPLLPNIYKSFFVHQSNFPSVGQHWNYFYLGYTPIFLSLAAFLIYWKNNFRYFILFVIFFLFSFGAHTRLDLFRLIFPLPIFHSIEAPTRYFSFLVIFIIALTAGSIFEFWSNKKIKLLKVFYILIIIFTTIDLFLTNSANDISFPVSLSKPIEEASFFQAKNVKPSSEISPLIPKKMFLIRSWEWTVPTQYELMLKNIGKINWNGNIHLGEYPEPKYFVDWNEAEYLDDLRYLWRLNPDYRGEIYFLNNSDNKAEFQYFSPNKIIAKVDLVKPDILIINQNYDKYWNSSVCQVINYNGLLAVKLNRQGTCLINFTYVPLSFYLGLGVSIITFILMAYNFKQIYKKQG